MQDPTAPNRDIAAERTPCSGRAATYVDLMSAADAHPCADALLDVLAAGDVDPHVLAIDLLRRALAHGDFGRSVANCHTDGVDSVALFDDSAAGGGMIRFYMAYHGQHRLAELYDGEGHFTVGIHNHRYRIAKIALNDTVYNVRTAVSERPTGLALHEYSFTSALRDGAMRVASRTLRDMEPISRDRLAPGQMSLMAARDLHTMQVPEREGSLGTAWLVIEGSPEPVQSLVYSPRDDLTMSADDLYLPMDPDHARSITETALALTQAAR